MMMIQDMMSQSPQTCRDDGTLDDVCRVLWDSDCGAVPIVDEAGGLVGMVTDRDATIAAWSRGEPMRRIPVRSVMSSDITTCNEGDNVSDVHEMMRMAQVRRVPVVDHERRLRGIVSVNDLALHAETHQGKAQSRALEEVGKTLSRVCRHREPTPIRVVA
jgi:CBS domain-containing protein